MKQSVRLANVFRSVTSVRRSVGWTVRHHRSVCHNLLIRPEATFPCTYRSTSFSYSGSPPQGRSIRQPRVAEGGRAGGEPANQVREKKDREQNRCSVRRKCGGYPVRGRDFLLIKQTNPKHHLKY